MQRGHMLDNGGGLQANGERALGGKGMSCTSVYAPLEKSALRVWRCGCALALER